MPIDERQYDSAIDFIRDDAEYSKIVGNISNKDDKLRIKAYELYNDFYHCRPEHMRVTIRGEDDDSIEIYIPSAKKCIEAVNRFLAVDFDYSLDPESGTVNDQTVVEEAYAQLFKKQEVVTKFNNMKRSMLIKGDALLHIQAMPWERPGRRICIHELRPEHYFPIEDAMTGYCMGCHIVDVMRNPRNSIQTQRVSDEFIVRRQTYRRVVDDNNVPTGAITSELTLWKVGHWDDRIPNPDLDLIQTVTEEFELPRTIQNLPVYHWRNNPPPNSTFGMSELAGSESIINALNQSFTDEDLTLITQGLGVYWTDASPPVDEHGNETEWEIGPGSVVQVGQGANFGRVSGVTSVSPYQEHVKPLDENMQQALGVPDIAIGVVDVATAESGIALQLKLGPLLAKNAEKELPLKSKTDEFLEDLLDWLLEYEGIQSNGVTVESLFGDPMPQNKQVQLTQVLDIWAQAPGVLPVSWLYEQLNAIMGYDLNEISDFQQAVEDAGQIAQSSMPPDPFAGAMVDEQGQPIDQGGQPPPQTNGAAPSFMPGG